MRATRDAPFTRSGCAGFVLTSTFNYFRFENVGDDIWIHKRLCSRVSGSYARLESSPLKGEGKENTKNEILNQVQNDGNAVSRSFAGDCRVLFVRSR